MSYHNTSTIIHGDGRVVTVDRSELSIENAALHAEVARLKAEVEAAKEREEQAARLLASIHAGGRHYADDHGWDQACSDAEIEVATLRASLATAEAARKEAEAERDDARELLASICFGNGYSEALRELINEDGVARGLAHANAHFNAAPFTLSAQLDELREATNCACSHGLPTHFESEGEGGKGCAACPCKQYAPAAWKAKEDAKR